MSSRVKVILATIAAAVLTFFMAMRRSKANSDTDTLEVFKGKLDETKLKFHKEQASAASKKAFQHIKKAREIAKQPEPTAKESMDEAIADWNNET